MKQRLRVVGEVGYGEGLPFGNSFGELCLSWRDDVVVLQGSMDVNHGFATVVFNNGKAQYFDSGGHKFTPRVEDWTDVRVLVLYDSKFEELP